MTGTAVDARGPGVRPRPTVHFTATDGWINDPYSVSWDGEGYHLYYQAIPGRVTWAPNCHWGYATSTDLVHWEEQPIALMPGPDEVGCWSGSYVPDGPDGPVILYTRVRGEDWSIGQVVHVQRSPDSADWDMETQDVVIGGPPDELDVRAVRDPYVWRDGTGWKLLLGAALTDGTAAALQYSSPDLRTWIYTGVLAYRSAQQTDGAWTGALWECPQLFALGLDWVLLVSVWDDDVLHYCAAAIGDYDGTTFTARHWQRLTYGSSAYAMSTFQDAQGRRCVLSWLREEPQNDRTLRGFAGAHSVVSVVTLIDGALVLQPHPTLDAATISTTVPDGKATTHPATTAVSLDISEDQCIRIADPHGNRAQLERTPNGLTIHRSGRTTETLPTGDGAVRLILDADLLEIFGPAAYGAYRIRPATGTTMLSKPKTAPT